MPAVFIDLTADSELDGSNKTPSASTASLSRSLAHRALNVSQAVPVKRRKSDAKDAFSALAASKYFDRSNHRELERRVASQPEPIRPSSSRSISSQEAQSVGRRQSPRRFSAWPATAPSAYHSPTPDSSSASIPHSTIADVIIPPQSSRQLEHKSPGYPSINGRASSSSLVSKPTPPLQPPTALSQTYYPTDAYQRKAIKGAYPKAKRVKRADTPLVLGAPGPLLTRPPDVRQQTHQTMQRKLRAIRGPEVTYDPAAEPRLADFIMNFEFVNTNPLRKGVVPVSEEFNAGCTCDGVCDEATCLCLSKEEDESNTNIVPYRRAPDDPHMMVLDPKFLTRKAMIYECSDRCGCNAGCWNRVVQNGRTVRLEIFYTGDRGFGLRSPDRIRAGQFIDCYTGEVITTAAADLREAIHTAHGTSYLFSLDFLNGQYEDYEEDASSSSSDEDNDEDDQDDQVTESGCKYVIDGRNFGGPTRFINHSCNPNCRMIPVSRNHADRDLYDLAFFALREIPPNTELTFDYNPGSEGGGGVGGGVVGKNAKIDPSAVRCLCGEANCRGQLWPNQRKKGVR
ncbi:SET domain-containing protein [Aspergillus violaceofuscus CBS 115571]|uniref:SET domain-containing protein n=1 Tax=Aspergillus violaceofuscus (strain CBS 115571) TaxID=1450538 RepID=A0A2V5H5A7_ASPV1|nr:SET domain-containing protein [Aspergillus violaceofuscus CBS 115571]